MSKPGMNVALTLILTGLALPAVAALPRTEASQTVPLTETASPARAGAQPIRVADDDRDDDDDEHDWRRSRRDGVEAVMRRGDDDDDRHEDDEDDDDDDDDGYAAPRRTGPAPAQNPLIGAPRVRVN